MIRKYSVACGLALFSTAALSHPGHEHVASFASGFIHPFMGVDHLLAMIALGVWAARCQGATLLLAPALFILSMLIGAVFALNGGTFLFAEQGIALSVLIIGLLVALVPQHGRIALLALPLIVAGAAMHGYVHAVEAPTGSGGLEVLVGLVIATGLLHAVGLLLGRHLQDRSILRIGAGIAVAMMGSVLILTVP